ncbi:hypothetical protein BDW22DRAFT_1454655 [Trametopsis cervina]|nr:hypothetical protein BDW22DRAFT_1454655 [Trametopsis cervina]
MWGDERPISVCLQAACPASRSSRPRPSPISMHDWFQDLPHNGYACYWLDYVSMNSLPNEIHRMILQHLGDLLEQEPQLSPGAHAIVRKTLAACALTQRTWRRMSQSLLHRVVTVHCGSFKDEFSSDEFKAFVQRCGPRITRLSFVANSFSHPIQVLNILSQFTLLERVSICQRWPASVPHFALDTYDLSAVAPPAPSLKAVCVRTDDQGILRMPLRHTLEVHSNIEPPNALSNPLSNPLLRLLLILATPEVTCRSNQNADIQSDSEPPIDWDSTYPTKLPAISSDSIADGNDNEPPKNAGRFMATSNPRLRRRYPTFLGFKELRNIGPEL